MYVTEISSCCGLEFVGFVTARRTTHCYSPTMQRVSKGGGKRGERERGREGRGGERGRGGGEETGTREAPSSSLSREGDREKVSDDAQGPG